MNNQTGKLPTVKAGCLFWPAVCFHCSADHEGMRMALPGSRRMPVIAPAVASVPQSDLTAEHLESWLWLQDAESGF